MAESFKKEMSDLYSEIDSAVSDHQNSYDDLVKSIEKTEKEYDKLRETATKTWEDAEKSIKKYNEQLEENQANAITNLGQRYVELKRDLSEVDSWMKKVAE
jgi:peptidoglycan hydrolase CwlO-like protein